MYLKISCKIPQIAKNLQKTKNNELIIFNHDYNNQLKIKPNINKINIDKYFLQCINENSK